MVTISIGDIFLEECNYKNGIEIQEFGLSQISLVEWHKRWPAYQRGFEQNKSITCCNLQAVYQAGK